MYKEISGFTKIYVDNEGSRFELGALIELYKDLVQQNNWASLVVTRNKVVITTDLDNYIFRRL